MGTEQLSKGSLSLVMLGVTTDHWSFNGMQGEKTDLHEGAMLHEYYFSGSVYSGAY